jgi:N-acetyl-gamma-glutamyl-phosphate reductase
MTGAVVLGATGYVGGELLRLIAGHPVFDLVAAVSESRAGDPIATVFPQLAPAYGERPFAAHDAWLDGIAADAELAVFSAAPHGASAAMIASVLAAAGKKNISARVVDASADFRYANREDYEFVYGGTHGAPHLLADFACAVPEHLPATDATHIGHPGCFATAILLASVPLVRLQTTVAPPCTRDREPCDSCIRAPADDQFRSALRPLREGYIRDRAVESRCRRVGR